jgi:predicted kinase
MRRLLVDANKAEHPANHGDAFRYVEREFPDAVKKEFSDAVKKALAGRRAGGCGADLYSPNLRVEVFSETQQLPGHICP